MPGELDGVIQVQMRVGGGGFEAPPPMPGGGIAPSTALTVPPPSLTGITQYLPAGFEQLTTEQRAMKKNMEEAFKLQREVFDFQRMLAKITGARDEEQKEKSNPAFLAMSKFIPLIAGMFGIGAIVSNTKLISGVLSTILELTGTFVDLILLPLMPLLVPALQLIGKVISQLAPLLVGITGVINNVVQKVGDYLDKGAKTNEEAQKFLNDMEKEALLNQGKMMNEFFTGLGSSLNTFFTIDLHNLVTDWSDNIAKFILSAIELPGAIIKAIGDALRNLPNNIAEAIRNLLPKLPEFPTFPPQPFQLPGTENPYFSGNLASYREPSPLSITSNVYIYGSQGTSTNTEEIRRAVRSGIEEGVNKVISERLRYHAS